MSACRKNRLPQAGGDRALWRRLTQEGCVPPTKCSYPPPHQNAYGVTGTRVQQIARFISPPALETHKAAPHLAPLHVPPLEVKDWEVYVNAISSRKSMRRVAHTQKHLWMNICESICGPFQTANNECRADHLGTAYSSKTVSIPSEGLFD